MKINNCLKFVFICFVLINVNESKADNLGPNDCLLNETNDCPISFMLKAFCIRDLSSCWHLEGSSSYSLDDVSFLRNYSLQLFGQTITDELIPQFSVMDWYPTETLHEVFEYGICYNSPASCYPEGQNGLTIYHDYGGCEPPEGSDPPCQGGPTDSAICQITPEACSGIFALD